MLQLTRIKFYLLLHDKRTRARKLIRIEIFNDNSARDARMPQQRALDFNRRNPPTTRLETIIAASHVMPVAVAVAAIQIARAHPTIDERIRAGFRFLPVI